MAQHRTRRWAALFLSAALTLSQIAPVAYAQAPGTGLCEHHPQHTDECGYTEGSEGTPCNHEHTEDCYTLVTECVHEHTEDCYTLVTECVHEHGPECYPEENGEPAGTESVSGNTATPSEAEEAKPTECTHVCSEESECITEVLDCKHEHDEACGYTPATQGTPCTYVCEICNPQDSGETEEIEPEAACICTEPCTEDNINEDCPVCGAEDADLTACKGEPATPSNAIDPAVTDVQALIDALPTAEELERMSQDEQAAIYEQVQAAYDAYNALSDEQKAQITGAEVFDELFAVFNSMTNTLVTVGGFNVEGDSSGYSYSSGILTINNDANLTISTNGQTADRIVVASGATATITLNNVSIATTNNNTPIDVPNNSTLTLNLVNGSQNTISATSSSVTDCGSPGIHVPSGAQLTIQGEGSLSVIGASVSNGSWAGVGIGGRAVGGVQTGEACGTVIILGGNVTVSGGSGGNKTPVGIGGGGSWYGGAGGTVIILNGNVAVTGGIGRGPGASGSQSGANGQGIRPSSSGSNTYDVYGNLILPDGVTLPGNITIYIPEGASLSLPEGASWPENVTITGGGSISPKLTATITISANLDKTHDGSAVSLDSSGYTYTGDTTTPTITITWHEDNSGTIGNQLTDNAAPSAPGTYWVKVSAAETNRYAAAEATKQFTISQPLDAPTNLKWDSDTPGQATWGTVTNASGYSVQLYKGGSTQGSPVTTSGTSYDFQITEAGSYTFTVTATGSGVYSDSSPSSQSTALHTVAFDTNGGTGTISMQLVPNGGTVTEPTAPTRTGHRFDGWYSDSNFAEGSKWTFSTSTVTAATALYAKWTAIDYDITITVQGGTGNTASASVNSTTATSANMGDTVTLTATPAEGYHFVEWQVTSGGVTISEQNTFTMPAGAVAITAVFEEHTFTGWTAGGNDTHTGTCSCGATTTRACTYENGVCTVCGYVDVTTTDPANSTVKEGETATFTVTATGDNVSCQWQSSINGGEWANISGATGSSYTTPAATMDMSGYQYRCVVSNTTGDSATSSAATLTVNKASSEIGDQKFVRYIVEHYKQNADGSYTLADTERPIGEVGETVTAVPKNYDGYTYNPNAAGTVTRGKLTEIKSDADIVTLKLYYDITLYTVTVNGSYAQTTGAGSYAEGATVAIDAGTRSGYTFDGWTSSDGVIFANAGSAQTTFTMPDQAVTITANWVKNSTEIGDQKFVRYIVEHYKQNADGSYTLADTERPIGEVGETVTAVPKTYDGYTYNPNAAGTVTSGKLTEIKSDADIVTLKLYYDITLYTVTVNNSYAQTTGAGSYAEGATVAIDAGTRDGYTFDGWTSSDGVTFANAGSAQTTFTMPDQAVTITANWVKNSTEIGDQKFVRYIVEHYKQNADGSYTLADTERPIGEVGETVTAAPKTYAGYTYNPNAVGTVSSGKLTEIKSNADIVTLKLYYDITLYTVTVNGSYAQTTGAGSYAEGATVAIDAGTRDGYTFDGWTGSDGVTFANAGSAQTTFTMPDQAVTVTANWVKKSTGGGGGGGSSYDYYTISATAGEGGSISPSGNISVREGRDKTFTITPHSGYVISDVRVDGVSVGAVASYTFDNVRRSHTIEATFAKGNPATGNPFTDVHPDDWFYDHVMFVYGNGLMNGTSATTFSPNEAATRAQVAVIFYRMAGSPAVTGDSPFTDVENGPGTAWYYNAVLWAHQNGIVAGYGDGTYHPGDPVTREQLAVMFYNYANYKGYDLSATSDLSGFTDAGKISDWALPAMRWAVGSGLMNGYGDGTLNPQGTATRAQLAAMLHNFIEHNKLVPSAVAPGGDSGTGGTSGTGSGGGGWTQQKPVPQTGDNSNIGLWISLCVLSFAGLVGTTIAYVHTKRRREEEAPDPLVI